MSVKNNKGVAAQALLEMDSIVSAIKEESKKTLGGMLNEAVKNALRESVEDDDEKDYEVIDDENDGAEDKKGKTSKKKTSSSDVSEDENDELEGGMSQGGQQMPQGGAQAGAGMQQAGGAAQGGMQSDPSMGGEEEAPMGGEDAGMDSAAGADAEGGNDEGWDEFSDYKVGDDTYDLTGENDYDNVVKIYKLLNDEDEVVVKKDGNTLQLKDNNAGTEYVIDLGGDSEDASADMEEPMSGEEDPSSLNEEEDFGNIAGFPGDEEDDFEGDGLDGMDDFDDTEDPLGGDDLDFEDDGLSDDTFASDNLGDDDEFGPDDEGWDEREEEFGNIGEKPWDRGSHFDDEEPGTEDELGDEDELDNNEIFENKRMKKPMKESKQVLFEVDLGYTDNYQDKDPIKGLSNNEPSKSGKSWHKGVPTGTSKPWAGQSKPKGKPFGEKTIEEGEDCCPKCGKCGAECTCDKEIEEANLSQSKWNDTHAVHNRVPAANQVPVLSSYHTWSALARLQNSSLRTRLQKPKR